MLRKATPLQILSLAVLVFQIYIPWSVPHFVTQDGPSHVYTAFVAKDLLFHRHTSPYHAIYRVQKTPLPNWTCTLLLAGFLGIFGPDRAEAFLASLCLLIAYASFWFCARSLSPDKDPPLLLANWLIQTWFLWAGFYNFYLGMAMLLVVMGIYLRFDNGLNRTRASVLAGGLLLLFFTHLVPAVLATMALVILAMWRRRGRRSSAWLIWALTPSALLIALYAAKFRDGTLYQPSVQAAFFQFPQKLFAFDFGWMGDQRFAWPAVLLLIVISAACMKRYEWRSFQGALVLTTAAVFLLYLLVPDAGFGGSVVKMRFAWAVFLFGGLLICSVERLRRWQVAMTVPLAVSLAMQLTVAAAQVRVTSDAVSGYLAAMNQVPQHSSFVRINSPAPSTARRFETDRLAFNPLIHVAALGAVRRHAVDLSDYQSATGTFAVAFKKSVDDDRRFSLWALESAGADCWISLDWIRETLPVAVEYAVYFSDSSADRSQLELIGVNPGLPFVRVYKLGAKL